MNLVDQRVYSQVKWSRSGVRHKDLCSRAIVTSDFFDEGVASSVKDKYEPERHDSSRS